MADLLALSCTRVRRYRKVNAGKSISKKSAAKDFVKRSEIIGKKYRKIAFFVLAATNYVSCKFDLLVYWGIWENRSSAISVSSYCRNYIIVIVSNAEYKHLRL